MDVRPEADEVLSVKDFNVREIRNMFKTGKIIDAKTIAGLAACGVI